MNESVQDNSRASQSSQVVLRREALSALGEYAEPVTHIELAVSSIWEMLLGLDRVGLDDDYFALGGNSLQAIEIFQQISQRYKVSVPVSSLYMESTVRQLAERIRQQLNESKSVKAVGSADVWSPVKLAAGEEPYLFLMPGLECEPIGFEQLVRAMRGNRAIYGLQLPGIYSNDEPCYEIRTMATEFAQGIARLAPTQPVQLLGQCAGGIVALEIARELHSRNIEVAQTVMLDPPWLYGVIGPEARSIRGRLVNGWRAVRNSIRGRLKRPLRYYVGYLRKGEKLNPYSINRRMVRHAYTLAARAHKPKLFPYPIELVGLAQRGDRRIERWQAFFRNNADVTIVQGQQTGDALRGANADIMQRLLQRPLASSEAAA